MNAEFDLSLTLPTEESTRILAQTIAARLGPGDVLLLAGDIGAGKSHFARAAILSLLLTPEDVPSPTYTLVQCYDGLVCEIWHADLYRLGDVGEVDELGLIDAFDSAICFVEWPDRLGPDAPPGALHLHLSTTDAPGARALTLRWTDPKWNWITGALAA